MIVGRLETFLKLTIFGPSERKGEETRSRDKKGTVIAIVKAICHLFVRSVEQMGLQRVMEVYREIKT